MVPVCDERYHIYNRFRHFWAEIKKLWNYPLFSFVKRIDARWRVSSGQYKCTSFFLQKWSFSFGQSVTQRTIKAHIYIVYNILYLNMSSIYIILRTIIVTKIVFLKYMYSEIWIKL